MLHYIMNNVSTAFPPEEATGTIVLECNRLNSVEVNTLGETDEQRSIWTNALGSGVKIYPGDEISIHSAYINQQGGGTDAIEFNGKQHLRTTRAADGTATTRITQDNKQKLSFSFYRSAEGTNYSFLPVPMATTGLAPALNNIANYYDCPQTWTKIGAGYLPNEDAFVNGGLINGSFQHDASRYTHMDLLSDYNTPDREQKKSRYRDADAIYSADYIDIVFTDYILTPHNTYLIGNNSTWLGGGAVDVRQRDYTQRAKIKTQDIELTLPTGFISADDVATSLTNQLQGITSISTGRLSTGSHYTDQINGDCNSLAIKNNVYQELDAIIEPVPLIKRSGGLDGTSQDPTTTTADQNNAGTTQHSVFDTYYIANRGNTMTTTGDGTGLGLLDSNKYFDSILFKNPDLVKAGQDLAQVGLNDSQHGNYLPITTNTSPSRQDPIRTALPFQFIRGAYMGDTALEYDLVPTSMISQRLAHLYNKNINPASTTKSNTYIMTNARWTYENLKLFETFFKSQDPAKDNYTNVAEVVFNNATSQPTYTYSEQYSTNKYRFINIENIFDSIAAAGEGADILYEESGDFTTPSPFTIAAQTTIGIAGRFGADNSSTNNINVNNTNAGILDIKQRTSGQTHLQYIDYDVSRADITPSNSPQTGIESWGGFAYRRSPNGFVAGIQDDRNDYISFKIPSNVAFLNGEMNVNFANKVGTTTIPVGDYWNAGITPTYPVIGTNTPFGTGNYPQNHFPALFSMGATDQASLGGAGRYVFWTTIDPTIPIVQTGACLPYSYVGWSPTFTSYGNEAMILTSGYTNSTEHRSAQNGATEDTTFGGGNEFRDMVGTSWNNQKIDKCMCGAKSMKIQYDGSVDGSIGRFSFTDLHTAPESGNYWATGDPFPQDWTGEWGDQDHQAQQLLRVPTHHNNAAPDYYNKQLATNYADWWLGTQKSGSVEYTDTGILNIGEVLKHPGFHSIGSVAHFLPEYNNTNTLNRPYGKGTAIDPMSVDIHSYPFYCGRSRQEDSGAVSWNGNGLNMPNVVSKISNAGDKVLRISPNYFENNVNENYNMMIANNINPKTGVVIDATCGVFLEDFNILPADFQSSLWSKLGFTYNQLHPTKGSRQGNTPNITAGFSYTDNAVLPLTTGADISQISQGSLVCGRYGYSQGITTMVGRVYDNLEHLCNFSEPGYTAGAINPLDNTENFGRYNTFTNAAIGRQTKKDYTNFTTNTDIDTPWGVKGDGFLDYTDGGSGFGTWNISQNQSDGLQLKQTSSMIQSFKLKKSQDYPYLTIFTDLINGQKYLGGGGSAEQLPAIGVVPKQNPSDDFFYNTYDEALTFKATKQYQVSQITTKIARPDGQLANVDRSSSVIYLIKRARTIVPPNLEPQFAKLQEEEMEKDLQDQTSEEERIEALLNTLTPTQYSAFKEVGAERMNLQEMEEFLLTQ